MPRGTAFINYRNAKSFLNLQLCITVPLQDERKINYNSKIF